MVTHASGARVLLGPQRAVNPEWPITPALLREVLRELDMEGFDLVVLDVSPELSPLNTTALCACDDVFVVVVPTAGGVQDAYRSTEALRRLGLRHQLRYIVNRSRAETDLSEPMADLGGQLIADIPDDESVITAENTHSLVGLEEFGPRGDRAAPSRPPRGQRVAQPVAVLTSLRLPRPSAGPRTDPVGRRSAAIAASTTVRCPLCSRRAISTSRRSIQHARLRPRRPSPVCVTRSRARCSCSSGSAGSRPST